ncbi:hypothetical protein DYB38_014343, partial [Aphanomyces astaci]
EGKKCKASVFAEDADESVEEAEAQAPQVEAVDLTAESDDDAGAAPTEDAVDWEAKGGVKRERLGQLEQQEAADLVKSAMHTVGADGVQKRLEKHLAREEAAKKVRTTEEAKAKRSQRPQLIRLTKQRLRRPDEVWLGHHRVMGENEEIRASREPP